MDYTFLNHNPNTWTAITIDGKLWAYKRVLPNGDYAQYTPKSLRNMFYWDKMQYFGVEQRRS